LREQLQRRHAYFNVYQGGTFAFYPHYMDYTKRPLNHQQVLAMLKQRNLLIQL